MEEPPQFFDICILCALPEEAEAVRNEFEARCQPFQLAFTEKRKYPYWHALVKNLREEPLAVLVMAMPFTGAVETPIFVQALLDEFHPRFIAMAGICAGDRKVAIGDLVVASYAFHHDAGKIETGKEGQDFLRPEWRTTGPQSRIIMYAQALTTWKRPLIEMKQRLLGRDLLPEEHPRCLIAPIASGMAVQVTYPFPRLQEHNRKVEFLDQEVAAFYRTLQEPPEVPFLAVKSVCDNGDPAKNDNYHDYAARASAVYLLHFIQEYVTEETMPRPYASTRAKPERASNPSKPTHIRVISRPSREGNKAMILFVLDKTEYTLEYIRYDNFFSSQIIFLKHEQQELVRLVVPFATLKSVEKHANFQIDGVDGLLTFKMSAVVGIMNIKVEVGGVEVFHN